MYKVFQIPRLLFHRFRDESQPIIPATRKTASSEPELHRVVAVKSDRILTISYHDCKHVESGKDVGFFSVYIGHGPAEIAGLIHSLEADLGAVRMLHIRCGPYISPHDTDKNCYDRISIDFPNPIRIDEYSGWIDPKIFKIASNALTLWNEEECLKENVRLASATA